MKKIILLLVWISLFSATMASTILSYLTRHEMFIIGQYLDNYHKKLEKESLEQQCKKYSSIITKIKNLNWKIEDKKVQAVLYLVYEYAKKWNKVCTVQSTKTNPTKEEIKNSITTWNKINYQNIKINNSYLRQNAILVPISGEAYNIYGVNLKSLYQNAFVNSILVKNIYWSEADSLIKKAYLVSMTWQILQSTNFSNWYAYFPLKKPFQLLANVNTPFYIAISLNNPENNNTNKKIKLIIEKENNWLKTQVVSAINWEELKWLITSSFASYNYLIRKSKIIISNYLNNPTLKVWTNKIYSFTLNTSWFESKLGKLNLNLNISDAYVDTNSFILKINWNKYPYVKFDYPNVNWNHYLKISFNNPYDITTWTKFDIYADFTRVPDNSVVYCQLKNLSNFTWEVDWSYTWNFSILYSDNSINWIVSYADKDWFTDAYLYFGNVFWWTLRK